MKYLLSTITAFFVIGSVFSVGFMLESENNQDEFSSVAHADWPDKNINELVEEADFIAIARFQDSYFEDDESMGIQRKYTEFKPLNVLKGEKLKQITISQAVDFVNDEQRDYLLFLTKGKDGNYYELTNKAIVPEMKGKFISDIKGFKGEKVQKEIQNKISSLKNN